MILKNSSKMSLEYSYVILNFFLKIDSVGAEHKIIATKSYFLFVFKVFFLSYLGFKSKKNINKRMTDIFHGHDIRF